MIRELDLTGCRTGDRLIIVGGNKQESVEFIRPIKDFLCAKGIRVTITGSALGLRGMTPPAYYVLLGNWQNRWDTRELLTNLRLIQAKELRFIEWEVGSV